MIPVYEAGEADGQLFIAMRFVEGIDLANADRARAALEPERAVRIVAQLASALDAAHARGLVHRDVKPANVLIGAAEHVYLTDFGLTKHATSRTRLTQTGLFVGTLDYAAPEQIRGEAIDARTDVYALGCVLYQTLTAPCPTTATSDVAKMYAHINEPPPSVAAARPDAPRRPRRRRRQGDGEGPAPTATPTAGELAPSGAKDALSGELAPRNAPPAGAAVRRAERT